jgi:TetR/AcrR family transcriptional regulator, cholesterol catabolism regulator
VARGDTPEDKLRGIISEYTNAVILNRKACAVYWDERKHLSRSVAAEVREAQRGFLNTMEELVVQAQDNGSLPTGEPAVVAEAILGEVTWTYRWYRDDGTLNPADIAEVFCSLAGLPMDKQPDRRKPRLRS